MLAGDGAQVVASVGGAPATQERCSLVCLADRSSRPQRSAEQTSAELEARICAERVRTGWGPRPIAIALGLPHSTVWKVLWRHGLSRPEKAPKEAVVRYEWPFCGDLLHMDVAKYPRFIRAGHAVTGDRRKTVEQRRFPLGSDHAHVIVDDHSRLAYVELSPTNAPAPSPPSSTAPWTGSPATASAPAG